MAQGHSSLRRPRESIALGGTAAGAVVGALVTGALFWQMNAKAFERQYLISVLGQASLTVELQSGKEHTVLKRIASKLPEYD